MDFNWSPQLCYNCQSLGKCTNCIYITDQDLNVKNIITQTVLPELWWAFQCMISLSSVTENGFNFVGASTFLDGYTPPSQVTHAGFWNVMRYFLSRVNEKFIQRQKARQ